MKKTVNLYLRGITSAVVGRPSPPSENDSDWVNNNVQLNKYDLTSFTIGGHARAWICGFGAIYSNGAWDDVGSLTSVSGYGWMGDWSNKQFLKLVGAVRQLNVMLSWLLERKHGNEWCIVSDGHHSMTDRVNLGHWGQLVHYIEKRNPGTQKYTMQQLMAGENGFTYDPKFFRQYGGVILLLSSPSRSMPQDFANVIAAALKEGQSLIVLQWDAGAGHLNFENIFYPNFGININGASRIVATAQACAAYRAFYGNHVIWSAAGLLSDPQQDAQLKRIGELHFEKATRNSENYWFQRVPNQADQTVLNGQPGEWWPFWRGEVDVPADEWNHDDVIEVKFNCCMAMGDVYSRTGMKFYTYPYKPDDAAPHDWQTGLDRGTHVITWNEDHKVDWSKVKLFSRVVGLGAYAANGSNPMLAGFSYVNGTYYRDTRGLNVYVISKATMQLVDRRIFDIHGSSGQGSADGQQAAGECAAYLNQWGGDVWIMVTMWDECSYNRLVGGLPAAMYRLGASRTVFESPKFAYRAAYHLLGSPGLAEGQAISEMYRGEKSSSADAFFDVCFEYDYDGWPQQIGIPFLEQRSTIYSRVVGFDVRGAKGFPGHYPPGRSVNRGYTVVSGVRYFDSRGFNVYVIDKDTHKVKDRRVFDLHGNGVEGGDGAQAAANCAAFLNSLPDDSCYVMVTMWDECSINRLQGGLPYAMYRIGASSEVYESKYFRYRSAYHVLGIPGAKEGNAVSELYRGYKSGDPDAYFEVGFNFNEFNEIYCTGTEKEFVFALVDGLNHMQAGMFSYIRTLQDIDGGMTVGRDYNVKLQDVRFHKLPMWDEQESIIKFENPCVNIMNYPAITINDVSLTEGHSGQQWVTFTVTASEPIMGRPLTVRARTKDGTARALSTETSVKNIGSDERGIPVLQYLDYDNTRVVLDGGFPKYYNNAFDVDRDNNIKKFVKNSLDWLNRGRNAKVLITGDVYPGAPSPTTAYSIKGSAPSDFGVALPNYIRSLGYQVDILGWTEMDGGAPSALVFDKYSVVLLFSSAYARLDSPPLGVSFCRSLENSVRRGTGLMLITDHLDEANGMGFASSANQLAHRFYAHFSGNFDRQYIDIDQVRATQGEHPLISGMTGKMNAFGSESRVDSNGTVGDPQDYVPVDTELTIDVGQTQATVSVLVNGDTLVEGEEYFWMLLYDLSRGEFTKDRGRCVIYDDDGTPFGSQASSGGQGVEWRRQLYRNTTGVFIVNSEHYTVPDRFDVFHDTWWVGGQPRPSPGVKPPYDFPGGPIHGFLPAQGGQWHLYLPHYAELDYTTFYDMRMQGTGSGTAWNYNTAEDTVKPVWGSYGMSAQQVRIHDTRTSGRSGPFRIKFTYNGGGLFILSRVGQEYLRVSGSGVYYMDHDPTRDFMYIEVKVDDGAYYGGQHEGGGQNGYMGTYSLEVI